MQSVKEGLVVMVVLMLGVTLLVALAMRHLAEMFSLDESKRDTRGVVVYDHDCKRKACHEQQRL